MISRKCLNMKCCWWTGFVLLLLQWSRVTSPPCSASAVWMHFPIALFRICNEKSYQKGHIKIVQTTNGSWREIVILNKRKSFQHVWCNVLEEMRERFAVELFLELELFSDIANLHIFVIAVRMSCVKVLLVVVQPNLSYTFVVSKQKNWVDFNWWWWRLKTNLAL